MPIYTFACKCGNTVDVIRCIADRNKPSYCALCPDGPRMKKVLSPTRGVVKNPAVPKRSK